MEQGLRQMCGHLVVCCMSFLQGAFSSTMTTGFSSSFVSHRQHRSARYRAQVHLGKVGVTRREPEA